MTVSAAGRGGRVEQDLLAVDWPEKLMAAGAGHIAVLAFQGELGPLVMIKQGRLPLGRVVAVPAGSDLVRIELRKLPAVDIFMALLALLRRLFEVHIDELGFQIRRLVAIDAGDGSMRARQGERCRAVIKAVQLFPGFRRVTGLAAHGLPVFAELGHPLLELPVMHVLMAARARQVFEVVGNLRFRLIFVGKLVAVAARYSQVAAGQRELGFVVLRESKGRRAVSLQVVALIALIVIRLAHELVVVLVHVAIGAALEVRDLEDGVFAFGRVALIALHLGMPLDQGIVGLGVRFHVE